MESNTAAWLDTYLATLNGLNDVERAIESRETYSHPDQLDQDYLDYVEEWQWHTTQQEVDLTNSVVHYYAKHHLTITCSCGNEHTLATTQNSVSNADTITDSLSVLPHLQCWYQEIRKNVKSAIQTMDENKTSYFIQPVLERLLRRIAAWRLTELSQTPILLGLDAFQTLWWALPDHEKSSKAREIYNRIPYEDARAIISEHQQATSNIPQEKHRILLHFPHSDHGLHALLNGSTDTEARRIVKFLNKRRYNIDPAATISWQQIQQKMSKCELCKAKPRNKPQDFPLAIYYAPPGSGKTTLLNKEKLIAFDTDWIGIGPTWVDYTELHEMGISVITNQHTAFIGGGLKIVGMYKKAVRKINGKPLTTASAVKAIYDAAGKNMFLIFTKDNVFFCDIIDQLYVYLLYLKRLVGTVIHQRPFYENENDPLWMKKYPRAIKRAFL